MNLSIQVSHKGIPISIKIEFYQETYKKTRTLYIARLIRPLYNLCKKQEQNKTKQNINQQKSR